MKKSVFLLGLLAIAGICLTACGSKSYEMSFDEALEIASHSAFQDILSNNDNIQQNLDIATNVETNGTNIVANLQTSSKQNNKTSKSDSSANFNVDINAKENGNVNINGKLNIKLLDESLYLNLDSLNITGSEDVSLLAAMIEGFKNQWFYMPMSGLNDASNGYLKNISELNNKTKELVNNEGLLVYSGKFSQFNGYNARKISLNNEKLQEIINEYYKSLNTLEVKEGEESDIPQLNIENFEGYLVITGKDKVAIVVENMDMIEGDTVVNANGFGGENYSLNLSSEGEDVIKVTANKKGSNYELAINVGDLTSLNGTITPKISKSSINVKFNVTLTVKSEYEGEPDTTIPLKGSWTYEPISEFEVVAPDDAQDLTEVIQSYLGSMFGGSDYDYEEDYDADYNYEDSYNEEMNNNTENIEVSDIETAEIDESEAE